jgi:hypothetical protein
VPCSLGLPLGETIEAKGAVGRNQHHCEACEAAMAEHIFAMILTFAASMAVLGCVTAVILAVIKRRPQKLAEPELRHALGDISDRLSRLDGAIETIAVEVERVSEAQRFTAKVLAERHGPPALPDKNREAITPH